MFQVKYSVVERKGQFLLVETDHFSGKVRTVFSFMNQENALEVMGILKKDIQEEYCAILRK